MAELDINSNSPQLDCSVDSGICVEVAAEDLKKKLQEFKRILFILERDKEARRLLRERLGRIAERRTVKRKKDEHFCNICFTSLDTNDFKACIACCSCAKYICREKCSEWVPNDAAWRCRLCTVNRDSYGKTSTWVEEQYSAKKTIPSYVHPMRARSEIYIPLCDPNDSAFLCNFESVSEAPSSVNVSQKQQIREYIEEVLAEMLGGTLDSTSVGPLLRNGQYNSTPGNENELQNVSHARLRRLIESIIAETAHQPRSASPENSRFNQQLNSLSYNGNHCNGNAGQYFEPKKYQDLLATAVLNKIVDTHGNGRHSESSPDLTSSAFDKNHNSLFPSKTDESISSSSSIEPRSESSLTDPLNNINKGDDVLSPTGSYRNFYGDVANENIDADRESVLSDFIASHMVPLPTISAEPASEEDIEDEDFISVTSSGRDPTWEDNWLFKKKRCSKTASSVGMLVPAPKEDIRALIGDKTTDEISDLSEVGSDTDESSQEMVSANTEPLNGRLLNQHLIGGKNTKVVLDELVEQSSLISTSSLPENTPPYTETKNDFVVSNDGLSEPEQSKISLSNCNTAVSNEAVNCNVTKSIPKESTEKTEVLAKEIPSTEEDSGVAPPNDYTDDEKMRNLMAKFNEEQEGKQVDGEETFSISPRSSTSGPLSGSIAEREYKKWYNAVDMPNNPYSAEALRRRLSGGHERVIDLPNISPCVEEKPIVLSEDENKVIDDKSQQRDYTRYSRDYYINDAKHASGATRKRFTPATTPSLTNSPSIKTPSTSSPSSIEIDDRSEGTMGFQYPVRSMGNKLEKQSNIEKEPDVYTATPARVEEIIPEQVFAEKEPQTASTISPLTTEAVGKLSSDSNSVPTTDSLTPSEDSDTVRIYDLKKQETRIVKDYQPSVPNTPKKARPTDLGITPDTIVSTPSKSTTPAPFKFLQPKRKLIEPSQVLSIDLDIEPISPTSTEKTVIEQEVVQSLPSVRALAQAFLLTSSSCPASDKWRKVSNLNRLQGPEAGISNSFVKARARSPAAPAKTTTPTLVATLAPTPATAPAVAVNQTPPEPQIIADTTSQESEDATIASDLSSLETDPPSKREANTSDSLELSQEPSQDRTLSPVLVPGCLKNNIAFFENLKNK